MSDFQFVQIPVSALNQHQPQYPPRNMMPPVRIRMALEYLQYTTMKQMKQGAVTSMAIEFVNGQQLSKAEANARESAANLLSEYFSGKMEADQWEKGELDSEKVKSARLMGGQPGAILSCIACGTRRRPECPFCKGSGEVIMFPNKLESGDE